MVETDQSLIQLFADCDLRQLIKICDDGEDLAEMLSLRVELSESKHELPQLDLSKPVPFTLSPAARELLSLSVVAGVLAGRSPQFDDLVLQSAHSREELLYALKELQRFELVRREGFVDEDPQVLLDRRLQPFSNTALGELSEQALTALSDAVSRKRAVDPAVRDELSRGRYLKRGSRQLAIEPLVVGIIDLPARLDAASKRVLLRRLGARQRLSALGA
jgi:hypothetical protein